MADYELIQTDAELVRLVARLRDARVQRLAIDVEGENNLHRYGIHVALIQLFDGARGFIVDPLAIRTTDLLKPLLENAPWELVWFDAGNDLLSFQHALGIRPSPILDLVIAARLLGKTGGLQVMTGTGGSARAKDKFQRANWLRRPLSPALLDYAISDVLHLHALADELLAELERRGLLEAFRLKNLETQNAERAWDPFANYTRIPGFNRLPREDAAVREGALVCAGALRPHARHAAGERGVQAGHAGDDRQGTALGGPDCALPQRAPPAQQDRTAGPGREVQGRRGAGCCGSEEAGPASMMGFAPRSAAVPRMAGEDDELPAARQMP